MSIATTDHSNAGDVSSSHGRDERLSAGDSASENRGGSSSKSSEGVESSRGTMTNGDGSNARHPGGLSSVAPPPPHEREGPSSLHNSTGGGSSNDAKSRADTAEGRASSGRGATNNVFAPQPAGMAERGQREQSGDAVASKSVPRIGEGGGIIRNHPRQCLKYSDFVAGDVGKLPGVNERRGVNSCEINKNTQCRIFRLFQLRERQRK